MTAWDLIRDAVQLVLQEMIETEALEHIGAGSTMSVPRILVSLNETGHRPRLLATQAGDVEFADPEAAQGQLSSRRFSSRAAHRLGVVSMIMEAYVAGVSTRSVDDLVAAGGRFGDLQVRGVTDLRRPR